MNKNKKYKDYQKQYRENKTDDQKQKMKDYQKEHRKNMTDEQNKNIKKLEKVIMLLMNKNKK